MRIKILMLVILTCALTRSAGAQSVLTTAQSTGSANTASQPNSAGSVNFDITNGIIKLAYGSAANSATWLKEHPYSSIRWYPSFGFNLSASPGTGASSTTTIWNPNSQGVAGQASMNISFSNLATSRESYMTSLGKAVGLELGSRAVSTGIYAVTEGVIAGKLPKETFSKIVVAELGVLSDQVKTLNVNAKQASAIAEANAKFESVVQLDLPAITDGQPVPANVAAELRNAYKALSTALNHVPVSTVPINGRLTWDSLTITGGYIRNQYKLVDTAAGAGDKTSTQEYNGWNIKAAYNAELGQLAAGPVIFGIACGVGRQNNANNLSSTTVQTIVSTYTSPTGVVTDVVKSTAALSGKYAESVNPTLDIDFIWKPKFLDPKYRFGIDLLSRTQYGNFNLINPGVAFFVSPKGQPLAVSEAVAVVRNAKNKAELDIVFGANF